MKELQPLGALLGQISLYVSIWIALVIILSVIIFLLVVKYIHDKKNNMAENNDKKEMILRICIYLVLGVLVFLLFPLLG